jgi:ADP-ribosyl-[dinitrogen reductase] hydrolase
MADSPFHLDPYVQTTDARSGRLSGCLLGLAVGDAVGTTVEFKPRGTFTPLTDMAGGGPYRLLPGQWTDDTSMALCLAASLIASDGFDAKDQVQRYLRWRDQGYMSSNGVCFDIGNTVSDALSRFESSGDPFAGSDHPRSAGNGCIMRLAPVPMFYSADREQAVHFAAESSRTTHGAAECLAACRLLASMLCEAFDGGTKESIMLNHDMLGLTEPKVVSIAEGGYIDKPASEICGSGYVVECLEAALWCFHHSDSYEEAVLMAANLGDDADTTAAVCGQLAGAYYGIGGIPSRWLQKLAGRSMIEQMARGLSPHVIRLNHSNTSRQFTTESSGI